MRVKEAPASTLRAIFGGIGSLLGVTDKMRAKPAAPETTAAPQTAAPEDAAPQTAAPQTAAPPAAPQTAAPEDAATLPLANYDDLSIASLRARLRNLSADQLAVLAEYEKGHAGRADVITMFERRIVKLAEA